ncbi:MAG: diguanylate cyclase [Proteobacteria bacterium]|nr:diguanylate cyclase [Pseudomonadota bacterium]
MAVLRLGHVNLRAPADTIERLRRFYVDAIGLREGPRPRFRSGSSGHWLYAGDHDVIHLRVDAHRENETPRGALDHFALLCDRADLAAARARLDAFAVEYTVDEVEETGQTQLFLHDPSGTAVEMTFVR